MNRGTTLWYWPDPTTTKKDMATAMKICTTAVEKAKAASLF